MDLALAQQVRSVWLDAATSSRVWRTMSESASRYEKILAWSMLIASSASVVSISQSVGLATGLGLVSSILAATNIVLKPKENAAKLRDAHLKWARLADKARALDVAIDSNNRPSDKAIRAALDGFETEQASARALTAGRHVPDHVWAAAQDAVCRANGLPLPSALAAQNEAKAAKALVAIEASDQGPTETATGG